MRSLGLLTLFLIMVGCSKSSVNARLVDGTSITDNPTVTPVDPNGNMCRHDGATNYNQQCTEDAGHCYFYACNDQRYAEFAKYEEYLAYVEKFGGDVFGDPSLCKTIKIPGKGCAHPDAINYAGPVTEKGACDFNACTDPLYQEYTSPHMQYKDYVDKYGGTIYPDNDKLCKNPIGSCAFDSPFVKNYDKDSLAENGSCHFSGCLAPGFLEYDPQLEDDYKKYLDILKDKGLTFTGKYINDACDKKLGCTQKDFIGYDKYAEVDDGSCSLSCCSLPGYKDTDPNCQKKIDDYQNLLISENTTLSGTLDAEACTAYKGCTYDKADSGYDPKNMDEDASCGIKCCDKLGYQNHDAACGVKKSEYEDILKDAGYTLGDAVNTDFAYNCGKKLGCTYDKSDSGYDPNAQYENASCEIKCCSLAGHEGFTQACVVKKQAYTDILAGVGLSLSDAANANFTYQCGKKLGCTYNKSDAGYDSTAQKDNGKCMISCCSTPGYDGYDPQCAVKKSEYEQILIDSGLTLADASYVDFNKCGDKEGCTYPKSDSGYDPTATKETGICDIKCCKKSGYENYDSECATKRTEYKDILANFGLSLSQAPNAKFTYNCGKKLGCTLNGSTNYDSTAQLDNKSCQIKCCSVEGTTGFSQACLDKKNSYKDILELLGYTLGDAQAANFAYQCGDKLGCTLNGASNYDSTAQTDDKTCEVQCCAKEGFEGFDQACLDKKDDYKTILELLGYTLSDATSADFDYMCGKQLGCTYDKSDAGYDPDAEKEDGKVCEINCCADLGYEGFEQSCADKKQEYTDILAGVGLSLSDADKVDFTYNCGKKLGCTYDKSDAGYDPDAEKEDGKVCEIKCCSKEGYSGFSTACVTKKQEYTDILTLAGLSLSDATLVDFEYMCGKKLGCTYPGAIEHDSTLEEDGSCDFEGCSDQKYANYDSNFDGTLKDYKDLLTSLGIAMHTGVITSNCEGLLGCKEELAVNYNGEAEVDDKSCKFKGCIDDKAYNYDGDLAQAIDGYGLGESVLVENTCKYDPYYACLCEDGSSKIITDADKAKVLVITDKSVLSTLQNGFNGQKVNFGRTLTALSINGSNTDAIIQSYIDGYGFEKLTNLEAESRPNTKDHIADHWAKTQLASGFQLDGAPYDLIGVVFRPDLVKMDGTKVVSAGEGRLIWKLRDLTTTVMVPCEPGPPPSGGGGNCNSIYGCPTTTTTVPGTTFCPEQQVVDKPNHVIMEYDLPVNGALSMSDWHYHWAKLKCLEGVPYITQLATLIKNFAFTKYQYKDCTSPSSQNAYGQHTQSGECGRTIVPMSQLRVNSFTESFFDGTAPWVLFEMKPLNVGNTLKRVLMPHTPTDIAAKGDVSGNTDIRDWNQVFSASKLAKVSGDFVSQFSDISNPFSDYTVPEKAIQNSYGMETSWTTELMTHPSITNLSDPEKTFSLYRYSLNTCNGCHTGAFLNHDSNSQNGLDLNSPALLNKYGVLPFSTITEANDFVHVHGDGTLSDFLTEDMTYRADHLETHLTNNYCKAPGSYTDLDPIVNTDVVRCKIDANEDNKLDSIDVQMLQSFVDNKSSLPACFILPDVNGDGVFNAADVSIISDHLQATSLTSMVDSIKNCENITAGFCPDQVTNCDPGTLLTAVQGGKSECLTEQERDELSGSVNDNTQSDSDGETECEAPKVLVQGKCILLSGNDDPDSGDDGSGAGDEGDEKSSENDSICEAPAVFIDGECKVR